MPDCRDPQEDQARAAEAEVLQAPEDALAGFLLLLAVARLEPLAAAQVELRQHPLEPRRLDGRGRLGERGAAALAELVRRPVAGAALGADQVAGLVLRLLLGLLLGPRLALVLLRRLERARNLGSGLPLLPRRPRGRDLGPGRLRAGGASGVAVDWVTLQPQRRRQRPEPRQARRLQARRARRSGGSRRPAWVAAAAVFGLLPKPGASARRRSAATT